MSTSRCTTSICFALDGNGWTKTGQSCIPGDTDLNIGPEHVYEVTAHGGGTLQVTLTPAPSADLMLVARHTCADPATQGSGMCSNDGAAGATETIYVPVVNDEKVFVAVDGAGLSAPERVGTYNISFRLQ